VTGSIAQTTNNNVGVAGMAFNVKIMPIKVIYTDWDDAWDAPFPYGLSTVARAIRYAVDNGARVMNMSFGAKASNQATLDAMQYAIGKGAFLVVSAGNEGVAQNVATWPAAYCKDLDGAIAVAALDYNYQRAPYSTHRDYVEIAAPGGNIAADANHDGYPDGILQQTFDEAAQASGIFNRFAYRFWQGTSMAAPHVTALAALLMDQGITSPVAIEAAMKKFATDLGPAGRDNDTGYGAIEPRATLRGLGVAR
jgi:serine protease